MTQVKKIRKIELTFYGYGTRDIIELKNIDMNIFTTPTKTSFTISGEMGKVELVTKKYLKKWKKKRR